VKSVLPYKIVIPLILGIVATVAVAINAELGFRRLAAANQQGAVALEMQANLLEMLNLIVDAETAQRGYLLTGKDEYLQPYRAAAAKIDETFHRLRELMVSHGTMEQRDTLGRINRLVGKRISEIEASIALYKQGDSALSQALMDTGIGRRTMDEIRAEADALIATHHGQFEAAAKRWSGDIGFARVGMETLTAATVAHLLIIWFLARRDAQQQEDRRRSVQLDKQRLEALVEERTAALSELSNYLQVVREEEKSKLARDIHDELGGILVSAKMDVAWVEQHLKDGDPKAMAKLARAQQALDDGVQIKRRIIEQLRPTLLDNLGLSAAIEWQVHEVCDSAGLHCTIELPPDDASIDPHVSIALYRILQEALTNILKYARATHVNVDLGVADGVVTLLIEDNGIGIPDDVQDDRLSHGIAGMRQRVKGLRGEFSIRRRPEGGTRIEVNIPFDVARGPEPPGVPDVG
jgi:hypothetical protein